MNATSSSPSAVSPSIAAVMGSFHKPLVETMLSAATREASAVGLEIRHRLWVPGSYEKPLALKLALERPEIAGAVVLGIIERGETKHGLVMGQTVSDAIVRLQLEFGKPIGVGILGPEVLEYQLEPRLEPYAIKAVQAVSWMLGLARQL